MNKVYVSPNFRLSEFACPCCKCVKVDSMLVSGLEAVKMLWRGRAVSINSGYRCPAYNALIGGHPNSKHMLGFAADITSPLSYHKIKYREQELPLLEATCFFAEDFPIFMQIGYYPENDFVHLSVNNDDGRKLIWLSLNDTLIYFDTVKEMLDYYKERSNE